MSLWPITSFSSFGGFPLLVDADITHSGGLQGLLLVSERPRVKCLVQGWRKPGTQGQTPAWPMTLQATFCAATDRRNSASPVPSKFLFIW
jgi:hypothetical protein